MPNGRIRESPMPPDWWNMELYSFVTVDLPLPAWVWEFMRRDRLREVLAGRPVDAVNPNPDFGFIENADYWNYYKPANHPYWDDIGKGPYFLPPAVNISGQWPPTFEGQQYRLVDEGLHNYIKLNVDLNRRDKVIIRDLKRILRDLRDSDPEPSRTLPKNDTWFSQRILQVWDLREFNMSWSTIARLVWFENPQDNSIAITNVRNAYNTARDYIDYGNWKKLARYIEL